MVGPVQSMEAEDFQFCMKSMFYAHVYTTLSVLPDMLERGGSILNVTSIGGRVTIPHFLPYCCAKAAAARQLLRALAKDKGEIRVTLAAEILATAHGMMPDLVNDILCFVNQQLPVAPPGHSATIEGEQLASQMPGWLDRLTLLGKSAQRRYQLHKT